MKEYFVFREEWYQLRKAVSKNVWYELETLMLQLRFENIDTDPKTIKNKNVRTLWVTVRQRILDSMENCERKKKQRAKSNTTPIAEERQPDTEDVVKEEKQSQTIDLSDSNTYSERLINFLDENKKLLKNFATYIAYGTICEDGQYVKEITIKKIIKIKEEYFGTDTKDALDFEEYMDRLIAERIEEMRNEQAVR